MPLDLNWKKKKKNTVNYFLRRDFKNRTADFSRRPKKYRSEFTFYNFNIFNATSFFIKKKKTSRSQAIQVTGGRRICNVYIDNIYTRATHQLSSTVSPDKAEGAFYFYELCNTWSFVPKARPRFFIFVNVFGIFHRHCCRWVSYRKISSLVPSKRTVYRTYNGWLSVPLSGKRGHHQNVHTMRIIKKK